MKRHTTFLEIIGGQIVSILWDVEYSYSADDFSKWQLLEAKRTKGTLTSAESADIEFIESIQCTASYTATSIRITQTYPISIREISNTLQINIDDWNKVSAHISKHKEGTATLGQAFKKEYDDLPF